MSGHIIIRGPSQLSVISVRLTMAFISKSDIVLSVRGNSEMFSELFFSHHNTSRVLRCFLHLFTTLYWAKKKVNILCVCVCFITFLSRLFFCLQTMRKRKRTSYLLLLVSLLRSHCSLLSFISKHMQEGTPLPFFLWHSTEPALLPPSLLSFSLSPSTAVEHGIQC